MANSPRNLVIKASERLNLPADVTAGVSRVELTGSRRLSVENHRGVGAFGPEFMELLTAQGPIAVRGRGLSLLLMNQRELVVVGQIDSVTLPQGQDG